MYCTGYFSSQKAKNIGTKVEESVYQAERKVDLGFEPRFIDSESIVLTAILINRP